MSESTRNAPRDDMEIACPSCGSVMDISDHQEAIACAVCNGRFVLARHLCPDCGAYHEEERAACATCGAALVRLCRNCQSVNWTGDERCFKCGESIDLLSQLSEKARKSTPDRLTEQMSAASQLNATEQDASNRRMAELMAIEEARQAEVRRQLAQRKRQERNMLIVVFVAVLFFLLVLISYALLSSLG